MPAPMLTRVSMDEGASSVRLLDRLYTRSGHFRAFDLSQDLEPFIEACRSPQGLADAIGMLDALSDGSRNAGFEKAVYVIQVEDDPICKIGISSNPLRRLSDLRQSHYRELSLYAVIFCPTRKSGSIEQTVLARAGTDRLMGEWIAEEPRSVLRMALEAARDRRFDVCDGRTWFEDMVARTRALYSVDRQRRAASHHKRQRNFMLGY